ncbi:MAG: sulfatase-like hydrolase/transferase [Dehalococcoidia bacterium]
MEKVKPNVIVIMSDDLGYEVIESNGGTSYKTPNIDSIAKNGVRFENAHVQPLCTPTRLQLMTGKYNFRNYIGFGTMAPKEKTFGHIFSENGYKTCIAGKWQLYSYFPIDEDDLNLRSKGQKIEDSGFDEYCVWHAHHTEDKGSRYKDPIIYENGNFLKETDGKYGEDIFADFINNFIEENKKDPFFVYFPMALTHRPLEPTPDSEDYGDFEPPSNKTLGGRTFEELEGWDDDPKYYKDMVEYHDKIVGKIIEKVKTAGISENTIIIYLGDNGTPIEVCSMMHKHTQVCGGKGLTNDRGTHVPMMCQWDGKITKGMISKDLIDSVDILPTILEIAEIKNDNDFKIDGRSFLPQLLGEKGNPRDWVFFHFEPMTPRNKTYSRFLRTKSWKLYETGEMFDLNKDPDEKNPITKNNDYAESFSERKKLQPIFSQMK